MIFSYFPWMAFDRESSTFPDTGTISRKCQWRVLVSQGNRNQFEKWSETAVGNTPSFCSLKVPGHLFDDPELFNFLFQTSTKYSARTIFAPDRFTVVFAFAFYGQVFFKYSIHPRAFREKRIFVRIYSICFSFICQFQKYK